MIFTDYLKYLECFYLAQAIEFFVLGLALYFLQRWQKKHPPKLVPVNPCSIKGCRLGSGHLMPCWDGTPDPNYKERTKT